MNALEGREFTAFLKQPSTSKLFTRICDSLARFQDDARVQLNNNIWSRIEQKRSRNWNWTGVSLCASMHIFYSIFEQECVVKLKAWDWIFEFPFPLEFVLQCNEIAQHKHQLKRCMKRASDLGLLGLIT